MSYGENTYQHMTPRELYKMGHRAILLKGKDCRVKQYQYGKRLAAEKSTNNDETEETIADDPAAATTLSVQQSLKYILKLDKKSLQQKISDNQNTLELLQDQGGQMRTKTIEDLKLTLMTIAVYKHLNV